MESNISTCNVNILILGDGNFSFSLSYAVHTLGLNRRESKRDLISRSTQRQDSDLTLEHKGLSENENSSPTLYATSYDSKDTVCKDERSLNNIKELNEFDNVVVLHDVDATDLSRSFTDSVKFKRVIFNFPHVGGKSNIKACRKLLENSFKSISDFINDDSDVFITLCKGQGGTPMDVGRNGYGNSWQVVTQAAKVGLILSDVLRFDLVAPSDYETAGYRGRLQTGFIKKDSLTHIFKKGNELPFSIGGHITPPSGESLISMADRCYSNGLSSFNPFQSPSHTFSQCSAYLGRVLEAEYCTCSSQLKHLFDEISKPHSLSVGKSQQSFHITTFDDWCPLNILMEIISSSTIRCTSQTFISSSIDISPFSYPVYEEFVFIDGTSRTSSLQEFISSLLLSFQAAFHGSSLELSWNTKESSKNIGLKVLKDKNNTFDVASVPDFLCNIPMESWLNLEPEITISRSINDMGGNSEKESNEQPSSLQYNKIAFSDYIMSERELAYFSKGKREKSFRCCFDSESPICILKVNGNVVGEVGICNFSKKQRAVKTEDHFGYAAIFRTDILASAILQIDDIRLFWSRDQTYQTHLWQSMVNLENEFRLPSPKVMYPLCYRHDLCFWINEFESEDVLFAAIRYCFHDVVHSVRLLRVLRHEESDSLSFCYRIIYSRCDGPLSKKESVELQNKLRLLLIDLKFELR